MHVGKTPLKFGVTSNFAHNTYSMPIDQDGLDFLVLKGFDLGKIANVYYTITMPGGFVIPHIDDCHPPLERWQVPVNPNGKAWNEVQGVFSPTNPYQMKQWEKHAFWNDGEEDRVHILVEYDSVPDLALESYFTVFPEDIPSELMELMAQLSLISTSN